MQSQVSRRDHGSALERRACLFSRRALPVVRQDFTAACAIRLAPSGFGLGLMPGLLPCAPRSATGAGLRRALERGAAVVVPRCARGGSGSLIEGRRAVSQHTIEHQLVPGLEALHQDPEEKPVHCEIQHTLRAQHPLAQLHSDHATAGRKHRPRRRLTRP